MIRFVKTRPTYVKILVGVLCLEVLLGAVYITQMIVNNPYKIQENSAVEPGGPTLSMSASVSTQPGQRFNIDLFLDTKASSVSAVDVTVTYDKSLLTANTISKGDFLPVALKSGIDSAAGTANIALGCDPVAPRQGIGKIATINFTARTVGTGIVNYTNISMIASIGQETNSLSSYTGSSVVVALAPTSVPPTLTSIPPTPYPSSPTTPPTPIRTPTPSGTPIPHKLVIYAAGTKVQNVYPNMQLLIDDEVVLEAFGVKGNPRLHQYKIYSYVSSVPITHSQVKIKFTNDFSTRTEDRDLYVNKIKIDGITYQTKAATVYSTGSWSKSGGCSIPGFKKTEELNCNGYFQY